MRQVATYETETTGDQDFTTGIKGVVP
ncbi:uncharacterized protein METZ01_LOCUS22535 [marine metagenome]|uniref:Uncharacterized protein n=1 Tax=marine metagenome TaxID=408172 RepID=A0A381PRM6_9ZZZZ